MLIPGQEEHLAKGSLFAFAQALYTRIMHIV